MSIPLVLGLLFLIVFAADILGRSTFLPRVALLMLGGLAVIVASTVILETIGPVLTRLALRNASAEQEPIA